MKRLLYITITLFALYIADAYGQNNIYPIGYNYTNDWLFCPGEGDQNWAKPEFDDTSWSHLSSRKLLDEQKQAPKNGFGWYRKKIVLPKELITNIQDNGYAVLCLGKLAACDEVYFNGKLIGKTGDFPPNYMGYNNKEREYLITQNVLNSEGEKNCIAIKFHDGWSKGGFVDAQASLSIWEVRVQDLVDINILIENDDFIFLKGEPAVINIEIKNKNKSELVGGLTINILTDKGTLIRKIDEQCQIAGNSTFQKQIRLDSLTPDFYTIKLEFKGSETNHLESLTFGYDPENIISPNDAQADMDTFWNNALSELKSVPGNFQMKLIQEKSNKDYEMYEVNMLSVGNDTIRGYYSKPLRKGKFPVIVEYMGYGSSPYFPNTTWDGYAYFVLSIRGQALNKPYNKYGTWFTAGIENKDDYYYRGGYLDAVRAIDFVCSRPEINPEKIAVRGGSQGGALSFAAAALDPRVKVVAASIPFMSDFPDYFRIAAWPKSDVDHYLKQHPEVSYEQVLNTLSYFDIKNLASRIRCPLIMGIGVQDKVCPPHINFAAYNEVISPKEWVACPMHGHSVGNNYYRESGKFIDKHLNIKQR